MPIPIHLAVSNPVKFWLEFVRQKLGERPVDPYAFWGLATRFRSLGFAGRPPSVLSFSVELDAPYESSAHPFLPFQAVTVAGPVTATGTLPGAAHLPAKVPSAYERPLPGARPGLTPQTATFVTLRLDVKDLDWGLVQQYVQELILASYVKRLQIGLPRGVDNPDKSQGTDPQLPDWAREPEVVIGILDDACPFAHQALRRADAPLASRVVALWDQTTVRPRQGNEPAPLGFPYGGQWENSELDRRMQRHLVNEEVDEAAVYASADVDFKPLAERASHAAAVLGLVAGGARATTRMPQPLDDGDGVPPAPPSFDDAAARAPLAVVQFPGEQMDVRAGRWLAVNALDGLHYLIHVARRLGRDINKPPPLTVNMSYGSMAGPHDGSGMLESAIDELCNLYGRDLAVVLAAGNAHGTLRDAEVPLGYRPSGVHAKQDLGPDESVSFTLFIPPDKQFETYLEIWFSVKGGTGEARPFLNIDTGTLHDNPGEVDIVVTAPDGRAWPTVACPGIHLVQSSAATPPADTEAGLFFMRKVSQGTRGSMALLVVAATQVSSNYVAAPAGRWLVTVRHKKPKSDTAARSFSVDAWVERDDTEVGAVRPQSARLVENADGSPSGLSDENTFTSIATGRMTFKAGALMDRGNGLESTQVSAYSAEAVDDLHGPDFSSVADTHAALPGIRVSGSQSGTVLRANGTSMAAPQAARYLVNELASPKTLAQVRHELENTGRGNARLGKKAV